MLIGLLLPAVQSAREAARQSQCSNNLKQVALGCHLFENANGTVPVLYSSSEQLGWMIPLLPFLEQGNLHDQYNFAQPWFDASNANVVKQRIGILECPSSPVQRIYTAKCSTFKGMDGKSLGTTVTFTVASTDYFAISGTSSTTTVKAPSTIPAGYFYAYPSASPPTRICPARLGCKVPRPSYTGLPRLKTVSPIR